MSQTKLNKISIIVLIMVFYYDLLKVTIIKIYFMLTSLILEIRKAFWVVIINSNSNYIYIFWFVNKTIVCTINCHKINHFCFSLHTVYFLRDILVAVYHLSNFRPLKNPTLNSTQFTLPLEVMKNVLHLAVGNG